MNTVPVSELSSERQAFPRKMLFQFSDDASDPLRPVCTVSLLSATPNPFPDGPILLDTGKQQGFTVPSTLGDQLSDNSVNDDGFRFHDAFHIGIMTRLGWSPVMRSLLSVKRRADPQIDEIEDGARAITMEESLVSFHKLLELYSDDDLSIGLAALSLLEYRRKHSVRSVDPIRHDAAVEAITDGVNLFNEVRQNLGGFVLANLDTKQATYANDASTLAVS